MNKKLVNRKPSVAGSFYSADKTELTRSIENCFRKAKPGLGLKPCAIVSPHAGYVFSGVVAASAFNQIDTSKNYKHIFVIGSSHSAWFEGASVYSSGNYVTPLGEVEVETDFADELKSKYDVFNASEKYHNDDHVIEVQLPFLQHIMKKGFKIVPIMIGGDSKSVCRKIAEALKPYFNNDNLFIISSDFSHYPCNDDAVKADKRTCDAILSNSPQNLIDAMAVNEQSKIRSLVTSLCSWTSVLTLLYMSEKNPDITTKFIDYQNSSKAGGDTSRVVGYNAIIFCLSQKASGDNFILDEKDKKDLLKIARLTVETYVKFHKLPDLDTSAFSSNIKKNCGAFVTLHEKGELRGCIGQFITDEPLYKTIREMAVSSSTKDYRFSPVQPSELGNISIEISVLSPLRKISSIKEIEMGKHGIYIKKGYSTGTFLPQVATETGWTKEEFLGHCARDKAGIGWDGWKNADIYVYTADVFSE